MKKTDDTLFNDSEYIEKVFESTDTGEKADDKMKMAFEIAHDVRKFEIELFWKRGTYFWAFILGSFTAYFAAINKFLKCGISYYAMVELPFLSKIALAVISFLCFFFCLSWVLVNKGSKFWQENWEAHINVLEDYFSGKLYKTFLNTKNAEFKKCPASKKAFEYSVTQITTVGSIVLTAVTFVLTLFHLVLFFDLSKRFSSWNDVCRSVITVIVFLILAVIAVYRLMKCIGKADKNKKAKKNKENQENQGKWRQI